MVRKFPPFRSERKKRSTSEGTPQFPNGISGNLPYHLTSNRNFRVFSPNGKHPLCRDSFILCENFTFHANFCNSILLFPSPMYATRYLCFQGNIRQMCILLLTAGDKWNIKVKYQLKSRRGTILFKTQIFISRIKQELI